ncbi:hypothetical protein BABINDRAFT_37307 [Babjeviella inositovora NRRL Y-12698]|uniref:Uncharacterized protein n=1 Tax=Babjeviella inositovora NRRL Y-12698 TaxID=984486 RepID=A0A1E3QPK0_9ASCO|nr:uncharacterized protein BABINDRAFT_37307 [Babjeviella inositovora NRRL Y-12698]ODQ79636.1 hypothetical protein BABINDRAFT_37307 [Babjeviella inositovora NRRL Y-12698]
MLRLAPISVARTATPALRAAFSGAASLGKYNRDLEIDIRERLDQLPPPNKLYHNADGTQRVIPDSELKILGELQVLVKDRELGVMDLLSLDEADKSFWTDNGDDLELLQIIPKVQSHSDSKIVDKIPYEDEKTGELKWKIVRGSSNEGWEKLIYYGFIPSLLAIFTVSLFKDEKSMTEWGSDELRLRVMEQELGSEEAAVAALKNSNKTPEEIKARDELIVERIIAGEYDKLNELRKKGPLFGNVKAQE